VKIPFAGNAIIDIAKLHDYCLDPDHPTGKHKAALFKSVFGITRDDAESLRRILLEAVVDNEAEERLKDKYGQRYRIDFELAWDEKTGTVRSGWILETDSETPRLTSCYPI